MPFFVQRRTGLLQWPGDTHTHDAKIGGGGDGTSGG
jgi:hypothetical protein